MSATPIPPNPDMYGSTTLSAAAVAIAPSMALPPSINILSPACEANGCAEDTIPFTPTAAGLFDLGKTDFGNTKPSFVGSLGTKSRYYKLILGCKLVKLAPAFW